MCEEERPRGGEAVVVVADEPCRPLLLSMFSVLKDLYVHTAKSFIRFKRRNPTSSNLC